MRLFLVRHAHALRAEEHPQRPLSPRGRSDTARMVAWLKGTTAFRPTQYWHSPLLRAVETAQLLQAGLDPEALLVETDDLLPDDDPHAMAERLASYPPEHDLALVGHEPHLSALATLLVRGREHPVQFVLRKGAILALERSSHVHKSSQQPRWRVRWHLSPELLPEGNSI